MTVSSVCTKTWKGKKDFVSAQFQIGVILIVAFVGNNWPKSYPRNDNHDPRMFAIMLGALAVASLATMRRVEKVPSRVTILSRFQNEEWKGWMQCAFILYHYYRVYGVYNEIRVFVSAYVWMTGFGNFLYFDKKKDFSVERMVSMWLRINYFPLLLSFFLGVPIDLYYVVPLHTIGFFMTMATCYISHIMEVKYGISYWRSRSMAIAVSLVAHILFYETKAVDFLLLFSKDVHLRFQIDKYSAWVGILSGLFWPKLTELSSAQSHKFLPKFIQFIGGLILLFVWWYAFGYMTDKYQYNPIHPYMFFIPVAGWLLLRNCSKLLTEVYSPVLEFFGKITLETYVLQFHVFMCKDVQHIPIVIPGSGADGSLILKTANMFLCGILFVALAYWAKKVTVTTQMTVTELVRELMASKVDDNGKEETDSFIDTESEQKSDEHEKSVEVKKETEMVEV